MLKNKRKTGKVAGQTKITFAKRLNLMRYFSVYDIKFVYFYIMKLIPQQSWQFAWIKVV